MKGYLNTVHLSIFGIWDIAKNKGRISLNFPLRIFARRGHKVLFLSSDRNQTTGNFDGIEIIRIPTIVSVIRKGKLESITTFLHLPFYYLNILIRLLLLNNVSIDIIYAHEYYSALPAYLISKILNIPYILRLYGISPKKNILTKIIEYLSFKLTPDLFIITNDGTSGDVIAQSYGIAESKICFWINGIDKQWANHGAPEGFKEKYAPNGEKILLTVSRLVGWKQVDIIIRAIPGVIAKNKNIKFIIIGDGDQRVNLENLAKDLGIFSYLRFEGAVDHSKVIDYFKICDMFISMNELSSISNPVLEAMLAGNAIIALNTGTTQDLIKSGLNGILLSVHEINRLSEKVLMLLADEALQKNLGDNAQKYILNNWPTWEQRANLEVDLIESLCLDSRKFLEMKNKCDSILNIKKIR